MVDCCGQALFANDVECDQLKDANGTEVPHYFNWNAEWSRSSAKESDLPTLRNGITRKSAIGGSNAAKAKPLT